MQNNKNLLQEFFQKRYLPLPEYDTICVGMNNNQQEWQSEIRLSNGIKFLGEIAFTKKAAESSAAEKALTELSRTARINQNNTLLLTNKEKFAKSIKVAVMIDAENLHHFHKSIPDKDYDTFDIYIFVSKNHYSVDEIFHERAIKIISPSTRVNGTDTCMQVFAGSCLAKELYQIYFIATRDKFGDNLVEMITSNHLGWESKKAYVITKYSQISDYL